MPYVYRSPWGHDMAWEREVVQRIRDGGRAPQMYSDGFPHVHSWGAPPIITGQVLWANEDDSRAAARAADQKALREALAASAEKRKAAAEAKRAEDARKAALQVERDRLALERVEQIRKETEVHRILSSQWSCIACGNRATIRPDGDGYRLTCHGMLCGKTAWGKHESLMGVLNR